MGERAETHRWVGTRLQRMWLDLELIWGRGRGGERGEGEVLSKVLS